MKKNVSKIIDFCRRKTGNFKSVLPKNFGHLKYLATRWESHLLISGMVCEKNESVG